MREKSRFFQDIGDLNEALKGLGIRKNITDYSSLAKMQWLLQLINY